MVNEAITYGAFVSPQSGGSQRRKLYGRIYPDEYTKIVEENFGISYESGWSFQLIDNGKSKDLWDY